MKEIVAVDNNWGIGFEGKLLQRIPEDMKRFTKLTTGKVVVMGLNTFESLPGSLPLKDRVNIVLCNEENREKILEGKDVRLCRNLDELMEVLKKYDPENVFVIGGGSIYRLLLPYCDEAYVTKIDKVYTADTFYPNLDEDDDWEAVSEEGPSYYKGIPFSYVVYKRT